MSEPGDLRWQHRIDAAEQAVRGMEGARQRVLDKLPGLAADPTLLGTPDRVALFAYFMALLRELGMDEQRERALQLAHEWIRTKRVPREHRCAVHNRLAALLAEAGESAAALEALDSARRAARSRLDQAYTRSHLALLAAEGEKWHQASAHSRAARRWAWGAGDSGYWLDVRLRSSFVLFLDARASHHERGTRQHASAVQTLCRQQIERWGPAHPRATEALVMTASVQHVIADESGKVDKMGRLTDVLAVAAQRSSTMLGARHPQARSVRAALDGVHALTEQTRRQIGLDTPESEPSDDAVLDLMVHELGWSSPADLLGEPHNVRMTGDETAALFRRAEDADAEARPEDYRRRPISEAYVWSPRATGRTARAVWLLLLPFLLVNLVHWMRPAAPGRHRMSRSYGVVVRLLALSLTGLLIAAVCEVALDLIAWQCAGTVSCADGRSWLGFVSPRRGGWWSQPGRRLALASLVPMAVVATLCLASRRSADAYEAQKPLGRDHPDGERDSPRSPLGRPGFWYGRRLAARLRAAHTAAGLLVVAEAVAWPTARFDRASGGSLALDVLGSLIQGAVLLGTAGVIWTVCRRGRSETIVDVRLDHAVTAALPAGAFGVLSSCLLYAAWERPTWQSTGLLHTGTLLTGITLAQGLLVALLVLITLLQARTHPTTGTALGGMGGPAVALLACALGAVFSSALADEVANWLDNSGTSTAYGPLPEPPALLTWQVSAVPPLMTVVLTLLVLIAVRRMQRQRAEIPRVRAEYARETGDGSRVRQIANARARAQLVDQAPAFVGVLAAAAAALGGAVVAQALTAQGTPGTPPPSVAAFAQTAQGLSTWLILLTMLLFTLRGLRTERESSTPRLGTILCDVGTFWPRASHPFAPPCYAERAVPDLEWRMATWAHRTGGRIVVQAHSHGSALATAAIWQLDPSLRHRVALLTYGSPLERVYGRWFPAHFGTPALVALRREVAWWRNLHRPADPLGGPMRLLGDFGPTVDGPPLKDAITLARTTTHPLPEPILGNAQYAADPAFATEWAALLVRVQRLG